MNQRAEQVFSQQMIEQAARVRWHERLLLRFVDAKRYAYLSRDTSIIIEYKKLFGKTFIINMHRSMGYGGMRTGGKTATAFSGMLFDIDPALAESYTAALTENLIKKPTIK